MPEKAPSISPAAHTAAGLDQAFGQLAEAGGWWTAAQRNAIAETERSPTAASIVTSFDGINRVSDATGTRLDPETTEQGGEQIIRDLGYEKLGEIASLRTGSSRARDVS